MKAKDLMIGDWVYTKVQVDDTGTEPVFEKIPQKVVELTEGVNGIYVKCTSTFDGAEIEPIPLTEEILETNSFLKVEAIEYPSHCVGISFLYRDTSEGLRIFVQNACVGGPTCTMIKTCKYVHEVQHMIKMCDIEKEIAL